MKAKLIRPVRPNAGIEAAYKRRMQRLVRSMHDSVLYWIKAKYKNNEPIVTETGQAQDALPADALRKAIRRLSKRWQINFNELADEVAKQFARSVSRNSDVALQRALKLGGWTVKFKLTRAQRDIINATIHENVALIKNLPQHYFVGVEGAVMRSVQAGGDLQSLTKALTKQYGITYKRAVTIARDQNNKATGALQRARYMEIGITQAKWLHSAGGKKPREKHLGFARGKLGGPFYNVKKGAPLGDAGEYVHPGQMINCRCSSRPVLPY